MIKMAIAFFLLMLALVILVALACAVARVWEHDSRLETGRALATPKPVYIASLGLIALSVVGSYLAFIILVLRDF